MKRDAAYTGLLQGEFDNCAELVVASSTNAQGIANAYNTYTDLVNNATGGSPGPTAPANASIPSTTIYSLANSIAACVNTTDPSSTQCQNLFSYAGTATTGTSANVFTATVGIAGHPATSASSIYNLAGPTPPFQPTLTTAPGDWSLPITFTGGKLNSIHVAVDVDAAGNVWVATLGGFAGTVEELSNSGTLLKTDLLDGTLDAPSALVVDTNGRPVITSSTLGDASVVALDPTSGAVANYYFDNTVLGTPSAVAIDASNNWIVADSTRNKLFQITPAGTLTTSANATASPYSVAVHPSGNVYAGNTSSANVDRFIGSISGTKGTTQTAFAKDRFGVLGNYVYSVAYNSPSIYKYDYTTLAVTSSYGFNASGSSGPRVDGQGNLWVGMINYACRTTRIALDFSTYDRFGCNGGATGQIYVDLAIDRSGNVWVARGQPGGLTELVGSATPVITPVSANLSWTTKI